MPRHVPAYIEAILKPFGEAAPGEPWYKFAWADDVLETSFGVIQKRFPEWSGYWLLMKLVEWKDYGEWDFEAFGPKKNVMGEYELSQVIDLGTGPVELWELPQDVLKLWVVCTQKEKIPHRSELLNAKREKLRARDEAWRQKFSDIYDDATSVEPYKSIIIPGIEPGKQIGHRTPDDVKVVLAEDVPERLRKQLTRPGNIRQIN